jgi:hypothetical protein
MQSPEFKSKSEAKDWLDLGKQSCKDALKLWLFVIVILLRLDSLLKNHKFTAEGEKRHIELQSQYNMYGSRTM